MSLLLEALKRAEKAKEEAQRRSREGGGASELRLAEPAAADAQKPVVTRDELPPITSPLEIQSEDLRVEAPATPREDLSLQNAAAAQPSRGGNAQEAAQRSAARKVFEAKVREPNPRLPFLITMGALGA
ncbi:MAG TPA: hypothetical protein VLA30_06570, partial [Burkholderiales bacterium]|nr:hypothetical protein [Burkholderiales bacterium]